MVGTILDSWRRRRKRVFRSEDWPSPSLLLPTFMQDFSTNFLSKVYTFFCQTASAFSRPKNAHWVLDFLLLFVLLTRLPASHIYCVYFRVYRSSWQISQRLCFYRNIILLSLCSKIFSTHPFYKKLGGNPSKNCDTYITLAWLHCWQMFLGFQKHVRHKYKSRV